MLVRSLNDASVLVADGQTFEAVAPGIFEVPEAVGRTLIRFPHFEEVQEPIEFVKNDADNTQDEEQMTKETGKKKRSSGKKG